MNNIIFKTLLLKGEAGNNIASIAKTATSGLTDTYTITLTDGSTTSFEVTNGKDGATGADGNGIVSIEKTATVGLVDTYTITYTNGNTDTFTVTNGSGGGSASEITFDPTNTSLPATADTVQKAIEALAPPVITVTLTLNGAKEDTITILDANNETVGTCAFESNQTSGTCQISVPSGGGTYKFVSAVAKEILTGSSDFEKTVSLTDAVTQTVNVMPDNMYWYGATPVGMGKGTYAWSTGQTVVDPTYNTNNIGLYQPTGGAGMWFGVLLPVDVTDYTTLKVITNYSSVSGNGVRVCSDVTMSDDLQNAPFSTYSYGSNGYNVLSVDISTLTGNQYLVLGNGETNGATGVIHAIIFE